MIEILNYGDSLKEGNYRVHSKFKNAINYFSGTAVISLVERKIGFGPINIVPRKLWPNKIDKFAIEGDKFIFNNSRIDLTTVSRYDSCLDKKSINKTIFKSNLKFFEKMLLEFSSPKSLAFLLDIKREEYFKTSFEREFIKRIRAGVAALLNLNLSKGITLIKGTGFGLTPSGDDFICGLLIALNTSQIIYNQNIIERMEKIYNLAIGTNLLSNTYLACAKNGRLFERFKNLIYALSINNKSAIKMCTSKLISFGETSGSDMGVGFIVGLKSKVLWSLKV